MIYPAHHDLPPIIKNYPWDWSFYITVADETMVLTGYVIKMVFLDSLDDVEDDALIVLTTVGGGGISVDADNNVTVTLTSAQTSGLQAGTIRYAVKLAASAEADPYLYVVGRINVITGDGVIPT